MERAKAFSERAYQDRKWGTIYMKPSDMEGWLAMLREELAAAEKIWATHKQVGLVAPKLYALVAAGIACCEKYDVAPR